MLQSRSDSPIVFLIWRELNIFCAESKVEHLCRSFGRQELDWQLRAWISKGRKMPHDDVICFCQNFDLHLFGCQLYYPNYFLFLLIFSNKCYKKKLYHLLPKIPQPAPIPDLSKILVERRSLPWGSDGLSCSRCLAFLVVTHSSTSDTLPDSISTCSVPPARLVNTLR